MNKEIKERKFHCNKNSNVLEDVNVDTMIISNKAYFKWLRQDSKPKPLNSQPNTQPFMSVWLNGWVFVYEHKWLRVRIPFQSLKLITPLSSNEFIDIKRTVECRFTLKRLCDMMRTQSQFFLSKKSINTSIVYMDEDYKINITLLKTNKYVKPMMEELNRYVFGLRIMNFGKGIIIFGIKSVIVLKKRIW